MSVSLKELRRELKQLKRRITSSGVRLASDFPDDPVGYAKYILRFDPTPDQIAIADALRVWPHRVLAPSGHNTGKSAAAGWLINWFYDSFRPGQTISIGPTRDNVEKIVWKEVRLMRGRAGLGDLMPRAPEMSDAPDHIAYGMTAACGEGFQGRHELRTFFVFDESCAIDPVFWNVTRSMFKQEHGHMWLCLFNPTDTTSQAYMEDHSTDENGRPLWTSIRMDCLRHPNIEAQLAGKPPLIPSAVSLSQVNEWVSVWCDEIDAQDATPADLEWPPQSGRWYRQGPEFQARCRGMWPEGGTYSVWSELIWRLAENAIIPLPITQLPEIGCDVASYGLDFTSMHVRWGGSSMKHESYQGWGAKRIFDRLKVLASECADMINATKPTSAAKVDAKRIPIKIDDDPEGRSISDFLQHDGYCLVPVGASTRSISGLYPNMRSELWFQLAKRARAGEVSFARLPKDVRERMRQQAMAVVWYLDGQGRRVVEPKEETKLKIGRSPDDMDSVNLAYLQGMEYQPTPEILPTEKRPAFDAERRPRRKLFG